ncbi:VOC family protein [Aurantivibrio infirmus]
MATTKGINHLGLAVSNLNQTRDFFIELLGWSESGRDDSYPRTAVSDGHVRLTLWQVDKNLDIKEFDRRKNIGLHHLALDVQSEQQLIDIYEKLKTQDDVNIEFAPELVGQGPRKHMMCNEPGGIRIEFIWQGS